MGACGAALMVQSSGSSQSSERSQPSSDSRAHVMRAPGSTSASSCRHGEARSSRRPTPHALAGSHPTRRARPRCHSLQAQIPSTEIHADDALTITLSSHPRWELRPTATPAEPRCRVIGLRIYFDAATSPAGVTNIYVQSMKRPPVTIRGWALGAEELETYRVDGPLSVIAPRHVAFDTPAPGCGWATARTVRSWWNAGRPTSFIDSWGRDRRRRRTSGGSFECDERRRGTHAHHRAQFEFSPLVAWLAAPILRRWLL